MKIKSDIFMHNGIIPVLYTCEGKGLRPTLAIFDIPEEAKSLVLIVDDPDAPNGDFVHWILWNISPKTLRIESDILPGGAVEGYTSLNKSGWVAPCPPSGIHHYHFKLYALDFLLSISKTSTKSDLLQAMQGHSIDSDTLIGLYEKGDT